MKDMLEFFKMKYKVFVPLIVVFVLLVAVYFLYKEYRYDNYRNKNDVLVYQYFGGMKKEYTAVITYNLKDSIVDVTAKDEKIEYDSRPIYYANQDKVLFPQEMSIVFPLKEGSQYKLYKYSIYSLQDEKHMITIGKTTDKYNYFFLYDGEGLFYFPDEVTLNIDGKEYKKLSGMSYVKVTGGYTMEYFDKESETSEVVEIHGKEITVSSENINVNLSKRYCTSFGNKILLVNTYNLNAVSN